MDWGILQGLGQGLTQVGSDISANAKADKLAKLREAETIRSEKRAQERALAVVKDTKIEADGEGAMWKKNYNMNGDVIGEPTLASATEIKEISDAELERKYKLDKYRTDATSSSQTILMNEKKLADYDEDRQLDNDVKRANIEQSGLQGRASMLRASNTGSGRSGSGGIEATATVAQGANALVKEYASTNKDVLKSKTNEDGVTNSELLKLAEEAIKVAQATGKDPRGIYSAGLQAFAATRKKTRKTD